MAAIGAYTPVLADSESQVTVCILDSGCNMENITGWNYLEGSDNLSDNSGHGTGVCEILLEKALDANLVMLKCFDGESENQTDDNTIIQAIKSTTVVRIAVPRFDSTPEIPIFPKIAVKLAKKAEPQA